jgi:hypothetical protein
MFVLVRACCWGQSEFVCFDLTLQELCVLKQAQASSLCSKP